MSEPMKRPNVDHVLASLKDFQRETVDYVFDRMYLAPTRTHRYLVADEVGLGKTLVARGVVARTVDHLWDTVPRIDIVYICSSGDIARQNVNRLNITGRADWALASRVTMLPTQLKDIQSRKVNFIAFTPGTTFNLASSGGQQDERLLLYWLLESAWGIRGAGAQNLLQHYVVDHRRFRSRIERFRVERTIDASLQKKFAEALSAHAAKDKAMGMETLRNRFDTLCGVFARARTNIPAAERKAQGDLIGELRSILASTCIRALEPDLVILDEFQRFKNLMTLDGDDDECEEARLARELFDYSHEGQKTRILLLSATPYKMYTTIDEAGDDDHYADFVQTLRFLHDSPRLTEDVAAKLRRYRSALCRTDIPLPELARLRDEIQYELSRVMVRTERLASSTDRNGMLREVPPPAMTLQADDVMAYRSLERIADYVEHADTVEYWKAAPYLMSFMDDYLLKRKLEARFQGDVTPYLIELMKGCRDLFLPHDVVGGKAPLDPPHARLRWLLETSLGSDNWQLLWIPATVPYYEPRGLYQNVDSASITKRLIFSAWQVAPKAIAALVSYEAERRMLEGSGDRAESLSATRDRFVPLLRFARSGGRLTGLPVLALVYPSYYLARVGDPALNASDAASRRPVEEILARAERQIARDLQPIIEARASASRQPDESWYWAAPLLLDHRNYNRANAAWLEQEELARLWAGSSGDDTVDDEDLPAGDSAWQEHVYHIRDFLNNRSKLGTPPADLTRVLAEMAVGGPGSTALRALGRVSGGTSSWANPEVRNAAGILASAFRSLFNVPEVIAMLRKRDATTPYWRQALGYALDGNLQAVLDEYVHLLRDALGLFDQSASKVASEIAAAAAEAIGLRTAPVVVDDLRPLRVDRKPSLKKHRMRARFAVRFGDSVEIEGKRASRKDAVRGAFNSPFWPFVLATTSVGQEGLDFHLYCHAVVHWNLPSNPVDLEQREGRVHRFKGHAIRKNIAMRYAVRGMDGNDVWESLFALARDNRLPGTSDIVPYWVFQVEGGAQIERHVPSLPMSKEEVRHRELRRSLAVYRMVFGQPRQDELLEYLLAQLSEAQIHERMEGLKIDLSPPTGARS